jgi:hypothetical protein
MTYHLVLAWRCTRCGCKGEVVCEVSDHVLLRWDRVVVAHAAVSPLCSEEWGEGGIAIHEPGAQALPEAS